MNSFPASLSPEMIFLTWSIPKSWIKSQFIRLTKKFSGKTWNLKADFDNKLLLNQINFQAKLGTWKRDKKARRTLQTHVKFSHCRKKPQPGKTQQFINCIWRMLKAPPLIPWTYTISVFVVTLSRVLVCVFEVFSSRSSHQKHLCSHSSIPGAASALG